MKIATFSAARDTVFRAVTKDGAITLNDDFPEFSSLYEVIAAGEFGQTGD